MTYIPLCYLRQLAYSNCLFNLLLRDLYENLSYLPWGSQVNNVYNIKLCISAILNYVLFQDLNPDNACVSFLKAANTEAENNF